MKKIYLFLLFFIGIFTSFSCSSDISEENKYGSIAGSVSDASTGEPVSTVNVKLSPVGHSTVTGSDGSFSFKNLEPAEYVLEISKEGYKANSAKVTVRSGEPTSAHILIERIPSIVTADRETLDFGDNQSLNTLSFNIVNSSYEDLEWEIEERCDWITEIKPMTGTLKYGKTEGIVVVIDRDILKPGENKAVIVIRSSNGSSQMNVIAIKLEEKLPSLNTLGATDVTSTSATLNGEITEKGVPAYTERGFVYSLEQMPTVENTIKKLSCPVNDKNEFSYKLSGLEYDRTYYVRAYAINSKGTSYSSNEVMVKTVRTLPSLKVSETTNITPSSATLNAEIVNPGSPVYKERGFVYSMNIEPTLENTIAKVQCPVNDKNEFSHDIYGLTYNQTYFVRAYAISDFGTTYSNNELTFKTTIIKPEVLTLDVDNADISSGTATFRGKISNIGEPAYIERGFVYSTMPEPTVNDNKIVANGSGETGNFSKYVTGLPKTTYYVRAYAKTPAGTTYGEEKVIEMEWIEIPSAGIAVQKEDLGRGSWPTAVEMCKSSTLGGYTDWRLPTKEELMVLYNNREKIGGFSTSCYWSRSTWSSTVSTYFYYIDFSNGSLINSCDVRWNDYYIRAVRTLTK